MKEIPEIILVAILIAAILGFASPKENITPIGKTTEEESGVIKMGNNINEKGTTDAKVNRRENIKTSFDKLGRYCHL